MSITLKSKSVLHALPSKLHCEKARDQTTEVAFKIVAIVKGLAHRPLGWVCRLGTHARALWLASKQKNSIRAHWYRDEYNFGDLFTPLLLRHYGYIPVYDNSSRSQLAATGSILERVPNRYSGIILGSGFISEKSQKTFPNAEILAVRGKLTRERLSPCRESVALGDPGLLASQIVVEREKKRYVLGIVPHYMDKNNRAIVRLSEFYTEEITVIDVEQEPEVVIKRIDQCQHILSSSLHGLVVADSLSIPNAWLLASKLRGGRFKFDDYYSSLRISVDTPVELSGSEDIEQLISLTSAKPADQIEKLKAGLHELWSGLHARRF